MGVETALGALFAAFGLAGAAGLNAWLPLLASALLVRLDVVELAEPFDELSSTTGLVVLAALTAADFVGDKVPAVDHALHAVGAVVAPVSGAVLFTGQTGLETDLPTLVSVALGALTAGSIHAGRAAVRPASTAATGGLGNPVLSLVEDLGSAGLTLVAFALALLAVAIVVALLVTLWRAWRRLRRFRSRAGRRPPPAPPPY